MNRSKTAELIAGMEQIRAELIAGNERIKEGIERLERSVNLASRKSPRDIAAGVSKAVNGAASRSRRL